MINDSVTDVNCVEKCSSDMKKNCYNENYNPKIYFILIALFLCSFVISINFYLFQSFCIIFLFYLFILFLVAWYMRVFFILTFFFHELKPLHLSSLKETPASEIRPVRNIWLWQREMQVQKQKCWSAAADFGFVQTGAEQSCLYSWTSLQSQPLST